ncbi:uncharacterized mitochondrial protein-like protein [Tanacetum coccineum]
MDYIKLLELGMKSYQHICWTMSFKKGKLTRPYSSKDTKMSSVGDLTFFLGLKVQQKKDDIFISQDKYIGKILKKFGFIEVKTASTPIETQKPLIKDEDGKEVDVHMYRSIIGSLMYLTSSRPDIMFAVCACTRYQVNPKVSHLHVVKRIFSDYIGASLDRKSTTGGCQFLRCRLISWQCKKQTVVANSTIEAEYVAASSCCRQVLWIQNQLLDYGPKTTTWNEFSSTMASAIICLATNQKFNFSKFIFEGMIRNLDNVSGKFLIYPRKPKRKDTQVPQSSDIVADEVVHKELGDSLVRATTNASSLEVDQDSGNITKTQSKATPNESSSLRTTLAGGSRGNTLRSDEDRLKINELMELCTTLQKKVLDLEKTKTTQANEIASLKRRVKKLEKKRSSRTHKLKRLYKVSLSAKVKSSGDEEDLGEDASKQGRRINAIDADEDITIINVQDDADKEMFDVDALNGEEVFVAGQNENVVKEVVDAAQVSTAATTVTITTEEITLAQALEALKTSKPKVKGIVFQVPGKSTTTKSTPTISSQESQDKGKGIMIKEHVKPMKKKDIIRLDEEVALKLQAEFDEEERLTREKDEKEKESNIALIEEWDDIQAKIDVDYQLSERLQAQEQEELSVEEKVKLFQQLLEQRRKHFAAKRGEKKRNKPPTQAQQRKIMCTYLKNMEGYKLKDLKLKGFDSIQEMFDRAFKMVNTFEDFRTELAEGKEKRAGEELIQESLKKQKSPRIVDWKIHKEGKKSCYQIIRADGKSQMYMIFSYMLKSFNREDLETLYKLVKAKYKSTRPVEDLDLVLWNDLKTMFEPHVEDAIYMLVEKRYPLTPPTIIDMLNKKLQGRIIGIKSLLNAASITAAHIRVNAAQLC